VKNTTRNTLLVTVAAAALMLGAGFASAQNANDSHGKPAEAAHEQKAPEAKTEQRPDSMPQKSPAPTAQAPVKPAATAQAPAAAKPESREPASTVQNSETPKPRAAESAAGHEPKSGAPTALSSDQHMKFRDAVRGEKTERLTDVHFAITVGEIVPGSVQLYRLPVSIVEYAPQYRDFEYIEVGDEILIVDPSTMRIVAVIEA
jgi:hypothetical protein